MVVLSPCLSNVEVPKPDDHTHTADALSITYDETAPTAWWVSQRSGTDLTVTYYTPDWGNTGIDTYDKGGATLLWSEFHYYDANGNDNGFDNDSRSTFIYYADTSNPGKPTETLDTDGPSYEYQYDIYGNIQYQWNYYDNTCIFNFYSYDDPAGDPYLAFPTGLLEETMTCKLTDIADLIIVSDTQYTYNNDGQVTDIAAPKPGYVNPAPSDPAYWVHTKMDYDAGNLTDKTVPVVYMPPLRILQLNTAISPAPGSRRKSLPRWAPAPAPK